MTVPRATGIVSTRPTVDTSTAKTNTDTESRVAPLRRVITVAANETAVHRMPTMAIPRPSKYNSTASAVPPPGPPLAMIDATTSAPPAAHIQNPNDASRTNETVAALSSEGTTSSATPRNRGARTPSTRA